MQPTNPEEKLPLKQLRIKLKTTDCFLNKAVTAAHFPIRMGVIPLHPPKAILVSVSNVFQPPKSHIKTYAMSPHVDNAGKLFVTRPCAHTLTRCGHTLQLWNRLYLPSALMFQLHLVTTIIANHR